MTCTWNISEKERMQGLILGGAKKKNWASKCARTNRPSMEERKEGLAGALGLI